MDKRSRHVWEFVETLLGPAIYLGFFGIVYLINSLACALSQGNSPFITDSQTVMTTTVAALALLALLLVARNATHGIGLLANEREDNEDSFMGLVTLTLAFLSALAVVWTALPAATVPLTC
jgi:surface polysaccharide O-acyltransferase-like enzyme